MTIFQDLRYALRTAWRDRTFSLIAVVTLALGIGANTALFTIVNAIVLAPLPFRSPEQLVRVTADFTRQPVSDVGLSIPELFDLRGADIFDDIAGVWPISANLTETDEPERVETARSTPTLDAGIGAQVGRVFSASDAQPGLPSSRSSAMPCGGGGSAAIRTSRQAHPHRQRHVFDHRRGAGVVPPSGARTNRREVWAPAGWLASPFRRNRSAARICCRAASAGSRPD
jgi:hypothetical protein